MKNLPHVWRCIRKNERCPARREIADADDPFGLENFNDTAQVRVARCVKRGSLRCREFVRRQITPGLVEKRQRAVVCHEMLCEKFSRRPEPFGKESPQPPSADFGTFAVESLNRPLGMLALGLADGSFDSHPVAHGADFSERHASLRHAERAGIHTEKYDTFVAAAKFAEVCFMRSPGVVEWVINKGDRRFEVQMIHGVAELACGFDELRCCG